MGLLKFSDYKKSRTEVKEAKNKELANKKFNEKLKTKLTDLGVTSIAELDEDQMTNLLDSLKPSVEESSTMEMMSVKEACGKVHEYAKAYEADEMKDHTYEGYMKEMMEMLKEMYESYMKESKSVPESTEINEGVATPEELASFISKEQKHFAAFLKPKKLSVDVNGDVVTIKPASGSFTITVDYGKSTVDTTGKPGFPESVSYVELMEYIKITKFKLNESENFEINEADIKDEAGFRKYAEDILKQAHGDDYDEAKAKKMIDDIAKKYGKDGDWGDAVGVVQQSLA